ncbi:MAG: cytidylate kinase family protein [Candidatus Kerfeldbacteria bacterium]
MIISLSGKPGSGKSTVARKLAADLGYERIYIGGMRREVARKKGMTLAEFNKWGEEGNDADAEFERYVEELGKTKDNFIIESRTAFHFIPRSLKIFIDVSPEEGAKRIWGAIEKNSQPNRNEDSNLQSHEDVLQSIKERMKSDDFRYKKYYDIDIFEEKNYDLFLDTTNLNPEEEYQAVYDFVKEKLVK